MLSFLAKAVVLGMQPLGHQALGVRIARVTGLGLCACVCV